MAKFGKTSLTRLEGVAPNLVKVLEAAIIDTPVDFSINEAVRTEKTQARYYTYGRTVVNPDTGPIKGNKFGMIVTNKNGTTNRSNHQIKADGYGHAVDIYPFVDGHILVNDKRVDGLLHTIAAHIKKTAAELKIPIVWGGAWKSPYDPPHFELK